ncbi:MAG: hypothetical protein RSE00_03060 [Clostridia bacterium]
MNPLQIANSKIKDLEIQKYNLKNELKVQNEYYEDKNVKTKKEFNSLTNKVTKLTNRVKALENINTNLRSENTSLKRELSKSQK